MPAATCALTGNLPVIERNIVKGGNTIILTLTNDTWVAVGTTFNAQRAAIIAGMVSAQSEATGWNDVVAAGLAVGAVVRTSNTVVTITLSAFATYDITAAETITVTVPAAAVAGAGDIVASPTFVITYTSDATSNVGTPSQYGGGVYGGMGSGITV
jgi:hypothetical protein